MPDPVNKETASLVRLLLLPLLIASAAAVALYFAISSYLLNDATEKIQNVLLSHRGFHQYLQKMMLPTYFKARDEGNIVGDFYTPEVLSSSFIIRNMHELYNQERKKEGLPEIYYKMASNNPRNPVNQADEFEASLITMFNERRDITEFRKVITIDGQKYLYYAKPFLTTSKACIRCHGRRTDAPPGLQALYPGEGGFNEKEGIIRAIESLRMPIQNQYQTAYIVTGSLATGILAMIALVLFNNRMRNLVRARTADLSLEVEERTAREKELEVKNAELERFTYTVSHDLKSPLITIKGFAGALQKDIATGRHDRLASDLTRITDAADKMTSLLNDLLELSRVGRMINPPVRVAMGDIVADALTRLAGVLKEHTVTVTVASDLPTVTADQPRLVEVMQNLIENAVKYRGEQQAVRIDVGCRSDNGETIFFVRDNGIGIDSRYHENIFGLFNKLDTQSEGTGIGLALVRRIIELHGGRIWVESAGVGQGSTFCFTLPGRLATVM